MTDDDSRSGLRVGGWIPPYQDSAGPAPRPGRSGGYPPYPYASPTPPQSLAPMWQRRWIVLLGVVIVVLAAVLGYLNADRDGNRQTQMLMPAPVFSPEPAVSLIPPPPSSPTVTTTVPVSETIPVTTRPDPRPTGRPITTRPRASSPAARFTVGSTIGLELADRPGLRVRHRDFRGRVDQIRTRLDRADSSFTIRKGLAGSCVSFEAVNYRGYFLRHRNFEIRLERRDNSQLFQQDATFCAVPTREPSTVLLRAVNYPDRAIVERNDRLLLERGGTAFRIRAPL